MKLKPVHLTALAGLAAIVLGVIVLVRAHTSTDAYLAWGLIALGAGALILAAT